MARDLNTCSGPWSGFWLQRGHRGHMRVGLTFSSGNVSGKGRDLIGEFTISGVYGADSASFTKFYRRHKVEYEGRWDGQMLFGQWIITRVQESGEFELWPETEELAVGELTAETREPVGV